MEPIVTVHSFNDAYAELAAVSITSLAHNNAKRECDIHIFESSLGEDMRAKILMIQRMYANARITFHHIPETAFEEVADERFGKETWYPLLAPEILGDLDKALLLEPDTLVCRDISELFDIDLGDSTLACHLWKTRFIGHLVLGKHLPLCFNGGVLLLNLRRIREKDAFDMGGLTDTVRAIRPRCSDEFLLWIAQESYLNYILDQQTFALYPVKFSFFPRFHFFLDYYADLAFDEIAEAFPNPAIIHFTHKKPDTKLCEAAMMMIRKWWEYHALSPFADPQRDAARLEEIVAYRKNLRNGLCSYENYNKFLFFDDLLEGVEKLKHFSKNGTRIVFYGMGLWGTVFARIARAMGLAPDRVCDLRKCGTTMDGIRIESPDTLKGDSGDAIVVVAIAEPQTLLEAKKTLLDLGVPENRILPVYEQLALGGRRWGEILDSISPI